MALNMPPSEFVPIAVSDNARMWKGDIGLMNTSKTNVVFTIDSLIAFLKTHQVEVDSNLNEFKNLPKYASFGKMEPIQTCKEETSAPVVATVATEAPAQAAEPPSQESSSSIPVQNSTQSSESRGPAATHQQNMPTQAPAATSNNADVFIPTRKVREPPGGGTLTIGNLFGGDEEPTYNRRVVSNGSSVLPEGNSSANRGFIPSRKVREPPGGVSQINAIFG